jgi:DNA processing protein
LIVVEAKEQSGSLITAQLALEMGKDVFAIPSDISRRNSLGANRLIQNASAKLLLSPDDILDEYGLLSQKPVENPQLHDISKNSLEYHILTALDGNSFTVDALVEMLGSNTNEIQIGL